MNRRPTGIRSETRPRRGTVSAVRRLDVVDASLQVVLRGNGPDDVVPVAGAALEPNLAAELREAIGGHDFSMFPVAAGLAGDGFVWRMVRIGVSDYFAVLLEPSTIVRRAAKLARRFSLDARESELLRLTVAGYTPCRIARRCEQDETTIEELQLRLTRKLGCGSLRDVVKMLDDRQRDDGMKLLSHFSELPPDWQRLSSF